MNDKLYIPVSDFQLSSDELASLIQLYQPVFMAPAASVYLSFYELGRNQKEISIPALCRMTHMDIETITIARHELERFALIKTYEQASTLTVVLQKPLSMRQFLNHPMFGRLYSLVCGPEQYRTMTTECCTRLPKVEGSDVSKSFDASRLAAWNEQFESEIETHQNEVFTPHFDGNEFFLSISERMFPQALRTDVIKQIVAEAGSLYQISYVDMKSFLFAATNTATLSFDTRKFMYSIETKYGKNNASKSSENVEDPYMLDPMAFFQYKQRHDYIADADRRLIESLSKNFEFDNRVINVLVEYVLETNHNAFSRAYVEKVAATWKRRGVETLEDALKQIVQPVQEPAKRTRSKKGTTAVMPTYSKDTTIEEDADALRERLAAIMDEKG